MNLNERGIENLCNGVVKQAVNDYRKALVDNHEYPLDKKAKDEIESLERFFTGDYFRFWQPNINGEALMNAVKDEVIEFNYDLKALHKSHHNNSEDEEAC